MIILTVAITMAAVVIGTQLQTPVYEASTNLQIAASIGGQLNYSELLGRYEQAAFREEIQASMITVIEPAIVPDEYSQPRVTLNYFLGLIIGLIGGLGLAFILENLVAK